MPIEQSRLYNLLNAGEQLQILFLTTAREVEAIVAKYSHLMTPEDQTTLTARLHSPEYLILAESNLLLQERIRYNYSWKRNQSEARRRQRQAENGTRPLSHRRKWQWELSSQGYLSPPKHGIPNPPPQGSSLASFSDISDSEYARQYQAWLASQPPEPPQPQHPHQTHPQLDPLEPAYDNELSTSQIARLLDEDDENLDEALQAAPDEDQGQDD